jgi:hypothetical protein
MNRPQPTPSAHPTTTTEPTAPRAPLPAVVERRTTHPLQGPETTVERVRRADNSTGERARTPDAAVRPGEWLVPPSAQLAEQRRDELAQRALRAQQPQVGAGVVMDRAVRLEGVVTPRAVAVARAERNGEAAAGLVRIAAVEQQARAKGEYIEPL